MNIFDKQVLEKIRKLLLQKKETIAAAESVTAGLLQFALSSVPDASRFFQGGLTAYNLGQKSKHLHVDPLHAEEVNSVSKRVATEMALHIANIFHSTWGLGITGYATPVPESGYKIYAFYTIVYKGKLKKTGRMNIVNSDPDQVQVAYVNTVLKALAKLI